MDVSRFPSPPRAYRSVGRRHRPAGSRRRKPRRCDAGHGERAHCVATHQPLGDRSLRRHQAGKVEQRHGVTRRRHGQRIIGMLRQPEDGSGIVGSWAMAASSNRLVGRTRHRPAPSHAQEIVHHIAAAQDSLSRNGARQREIDISDHANDEPTFLGRHRASRAFRAGPTPGSSAPCRRAPRSRDRRAPRRR